MVAQLLLGKAFVHAKQQQLRQAEAPGKQQRWHGQRVVDMGQ
jgi:hypothetical protein